MRERDKVRLPGGWPVGGHGNCDRVCVGGGSFLLHAGRGDQDGEKLCGAYGPHFRREMVLYHDSNSAHNVFVGRMVLRNARYIGANEHAKPELENEWRSVADAYRRGFDLLTRSCSGFAMNCSRSLKRTVMLRASHAVPVAKPCFETQTSSTTAINIKGY